MIRPRIRRHSAGFALSNFPGWEGGKIANAAHQPPNCLAFRCRTRARWDQVESPSRFRLLFAHDLFRKTASHFSGSCARRYQLNCALRHAGARPPRAVVCGRRVGRFARSLRAISDRWQARGHFFTTPSGSAREQPADLVRAGQPPGDRAAISSFGHRRWPGRGTIFFAGHRQLLYRGNADRERRKVRHQCNDRRASDLTVRYEAARDQPDLGALGDGSRQ